MYWSHKAAQEKQWADSADTTAQGFPLSYRFASIKPSRPGVSSSRRQHKQPGQSPSLRQCILHAARCAFISFVTVIVLLLGVAATAHAQTITVGIGQNTYRNVTLPSAPNPCKGCHMGNLPPDTTGGSEPGHLDGSNNRAFIKTAMQNAPAIMGVTFSPIPSDLVIQTLAMYIGQFKAPILQGSSAVTALVRSSGNVSGTVDVYPRLKTDGTSGVAQDGGVSVVSAPNALSTSVSVVDDLVNNVPQYNITYNPGATLGTDTLTFKFVNPASAGVTGTVTVTVVGISSGNLTTTTSTAVNYPITVVGAVPTSYSIVSGSLPPGLSLAGGSITGTPNANASGTYNFRAQANTPAGNVDKDITFTVVGVRLNGANSGSVPAIIAGTQSTVLTTQTFSTNGTTSGANPFSISAGTLPAGLSLDTAAGTITGTPTNGGNTSLTVSVATTLGTINLPVQFQIAFGGTPTVTGPTTATGTVGTNISAPGVQLVATNPAITAYSASGLPPGLSLNTLNGQITGTPTQSQSAGNSNIFNVTVNATNGAGTGGNSTLAFTINPNVAPTLTAASLTPSQNVAFTYDVRANNVTNLAVAVPITGFSATGLPAGLSINASGVISGTATTSGGPTAVQITATNSAGTSATATFTFNVTPTVMPGITSPTAVGGTIGLAITPVQIVATNPPIVSYSATGLPPGITVSPTGLIGGTPTASGTFNATLTATNGAGPGTRIVPFTIAALPATAGAGTMTVPLNTPTTVDLATFITGTGITGAQITSNPAHGQVTVNGTRATYTPASNYFGSDSFSYVAFGTTGTSAPATVTVNIVGRPDPTADATVVGTINNQVDTARRFSQSQVTNFQRRMETLHRGGSAPGSGSAQASADPDRTERTLADNSSARLRPPFNAQNADPFANAQNTLAAAFPAVRLASVAPSTDAANPATGALSPATGAANPATNAIAAVAPGMLGSMASFASNRTLNLASLGTVGGRTEPTAGATSFWLGGDARFGTRDPVSGSMGGTSFRTDGISAGADRRFSDQLVLGVGLGFAHDKASIGTDGTQSRATGTSAAFYASYQPTEKTFVDGLIGYGALSLDATRFVSPIASYASSHRSGNQLFGSVTAGYELRKYDLLVSPYGRLDFTVNKLKQTSETGAGQFSLTYFDQTDHTLRTSLGLRAESSHETDWGTAKPRIRVEYQHGFEGGSSARLAYSDLIGGPNYTVDSTVSDRNTIVVGLGSTLEMRNGLKLGIDYQVMRSFAQETSQALRLTLAKEFDGKGSSASLLPNFDSTRPPWGINVDAGYLYDRNVSRGRDSGEKLSDQSYTLNLNKGWIFPVTEHTRAVVALSGGAEKFHDYEGLSRLYASALGEFQYRTSGDFSAPTYALFMRLTGEQFESYLRDGYRTATGLSIRKPVTDRISLFGAVTHNERGAQSRVFTGRDNSVRINVDYAATATSTLYLTGEYRRGDTVSSGFPSLASLDIAKWLARDDAFNDQLFAYRFAATTAVATLGYNLPFGPRDALDLSYRRVQSTSVESSIVYGKSRYFTDQLSLSYLLRF